MADYISRTYYGDVIRRADGKVVAPVSDIEDPDYQAWLAWCDAGNTPDTDDTMPPPDDVPRMLTARQIRLALLHAGLLDTVEAAVAQAPREVQIEWEYATEFVRDYSTLVTYATQLGLDVDAIFTLGATL